MTVISFQYQKYLPIGRGGMILLDDVAMYNRLQRLVRDGRDRTINHRIDNVNEIGFHYHMIPEDAARGIKLFDLRKGTSFAGWSWQDYTNLKDKDIFKEK
jgi:dTDP-4-amino-4,6-dideoxygalactose transaminase